MHIIGQKNIGDEEEMKKIIVNSNNSEYVYKWYETIGNKKEMKQVIINNNIEYAMIWTKI